MDENLSWKAHVFNVTSKESKTVFVSNNKYYLSCNVLRILHFSIILPYFTYCVEVWGNTYKTNLMLLRLQQKKVI